MATTSATPFLTAQHLHRPRLLRALPSALLLLGCLSAAAAAPRWKAADAVPHFEGCWAPVKNAAYILTIQRRGNLLHFHDSRFDYTLAAFGKTVGFVKHCKPVRGYFALSADGNTLMEHCFVAGQEQPVSVYMRLTGPPLRAVQRQGRWFLESVIGRWVGPFDRVRSLGDGQYAAMIAGKWQVFTPEGNLASGFAWQDIQPLAPGRYAGRNSRSQWQLLSATGQPVSRSAWNQIQAIPKRMYSR
ncbi:MAG TPA: hypothetical protein VKT32_04440 [Chthonomonadaceae bacterium]|nr:hypothetical protein [Chthonomonadaceae bacterium]